jgi:AcrR family transcriptional regulator
MKTARIDVAAIRREQIIEAAVAVITEQGLQNLSLSEIEKKAGMSRGQLTYYFPTKEAILVAVFDRLVLLMGQQQESREGASAVCRGAFLRWQDVVTQVLGMILQDTPHHPEFGVLQYTFLSQISHREDYRQRLASLYAMWRGKMADLLSNNQQSRALATLIQALFHGLAIQHAADPAAVNREEMIALCLDVLETYLRNAPERGPEGLLGVNREPTS